MVTQSVYCDGEKVHYPVCSQREPVYGLHTIFLLPGFTGPVLKGEGEDANPCPLRFLTRIQGSNYILQGSRALLRFEFFGYTVPKQLVPNSRSLPTTPLFFSYWRLSFLLGSRIYPPLESVRSAKIIRKLV